MVRLSWIVCQLCWGSDRVIWQIAGQLGSQGTRVMFWLELRRSAWCSMCCSTQRAMHVLRLAACASPIIGWHVARCLSRRILKTLMGSSKGKREQYLLAVGLGRYKLARVTISVMPTSERIVLKAFRLCFSKRYDHDMIRKCCDWACESPLEGYTNLYNSENTFVCWGEDGHF